MIWIGAEDVILIHSRIIQATGGIDGLRDRASLEAALVAPLQSYAGQDLFPRISDERVRPALTIGC